jgi:cardiolipin synthase A/B
LNAGKGRRTNACLHLSQEFGHVRAMNSAAALPIFAGTVAGQALTILVDGAARYDQTMAAIGEARESLRLFYYIFADDAQGRAVRDSLVAACQRGVAVVLLVDGFGTQKLDDLFLQTIVEAGGRVDRFLPKMGRRYLLRNHQKMLIVDGRKVLIGGANIAGDYFFEPERGSQWHDLMLVVEGDVVPRLAQYFDALESWMASEKQGIRALQRLLVLHSDTTGPMRWLMGGPFQRLNPFASALRLDLEAAAAVDMIQAYFAPDFTFLRRLGRVAKRGRLRLLTAAYSDNTTTIGAARHCYPGLLKRRAQIYEYDRAKLHMKLIVADDAVYIGSANCDTRSLFINVELMLRIEDHGFANAMRSFCAGQLAQSRQVDKDWLKRVSGPFRRLRWLGAYFLVSTVDYTVSRRVNIGPDRRRWFRRWRSS